MFSTPLHPIDVRLLLAVPMREGMTYKSSDGGSIVASGETKWQPANLIARVLFVGEKGRVFATLARYGTRWYAWLDGAEFEVAS